MVDEVAAASERASAVIEQSAISECAFVCESD